MSVFNEPSKNLIADRRNDRLECSKDWSECKGDEHQEEEGREDVGRQPGTNSGYNFRINYECEAGSALPNQNNECESGLKVRKFSLQPFKF